MVIGGEGAQSGALSDSTPIGSPVMARDLRSRPPPTSSSPAAEASPVPRAARVARGGIDHRVRITPCWAPPRTRDGVHGIRKSWPQARPPSGDRQWGPNSRHVTPVPPGPIKYRAGWCARDIAGPRELALPKPRVITTRTWISLLPPKPLARWHRTWHGKHATAPRGSRGLRASVKDCRNITRGGVWSG